MIKKTLIGLFTILYISASAGEGMWIPLFLGELNEAEMKEMGMRISAEDIYSINNASLKDAIVIFGGGCTGEIVSDQGLMLTNHHCGYGRIQSHSSLEHDYLTDGFWAMNREEELPNPGLSVTFLISMEDVTERVLENVIDNMTEATRDSVIDQNIEKIKSEAVDEDSHYKARVVPFYSGNQYFLFITEVYEDVRLVGAPPSNIGKFGGDTDNWMWPRHTGDFSVFRIYADSNNRPAKYSEDNVPYKPKKHMPVSLKGVEKGDFTFVFGYPGSTQQYIPSFAVELITEVQNPIRIDLREKRINVMNRYIKDDDLVRIQYSAKLAGIANGWKKWIGESRGIARMEAIAEKQKMEDEFQVWANADPLRKEKYGELLDAFEGTYTDLEPVEEAFTYVVEAGMGIELVRYAYSFNKLVNASKEDPDDEEIARILEEYENSAERFFKNYYLPIDYEIFSILLGSYYDNLDPSSWPAAFEEIRDKYSGDIDAYREEVFEKSIFTSAENVDVFLDNYKPGKYKKIEKDPAYRLASSIYQEYFNDIRPELRSLDGRIDSLQRIYMKAQMEFMPGHRFYPDANFTLRVTYGNVDGYYPMDAVYYEYYTTLEGIMEKEDPDIYDYVVEDKLKQLYKEKDYGRYAHKDGTMRVCFIATNHTSGGNSGSPVLNADGHLVGLNFDRNWEGTMSDIVYDPDQCRNITLDIRYCLFIMDKFAGAGYLVDEMTLIE
jgi:hypothetical protein